MAISINRVMIAGNLTRDPQVRFLANEQAVVNFGLALNRTFKAADGSKKEEVTFVDVEAWGRTAELVGQYLTKGRACFIEGRLKLDQWEDKEGKKQSKLRVVADQVHFLDSGRPKTGGEGSSGGDAAGDEPASAPAPRPAKPAASSEALPDEPPF